jgi:hypothetical protein
MVVLSACVNSVFFVAPETAVAFASRGDLDAGSGSNASAAQQRLEASPHAALVAAMRGALAAADGHPEDLRLQRRAAVLVRELAADQPVAPIERAAIERLLARLHDQPCPGLFDEALTRESLGDHGGAGDAYLAAARVCDSIDATVAAVVPLREAGRCGDAVAALRDTWPRLDHQTPGATFPVLDGIAACSDRLNLRSNLAFLPPDVLEAYLSVHHHWRS